MLSIHDHFQNSRRLRSDVDVAVLANEAVKDQIRAWRRPELADSDDMKSAIQHAAEAVVDIEELEIDESPEG